MSFVGFRAEHDGGTCERCTVGFVRGDQIRFNTRNRLEHTDCELAQGAGDDVPELSTNERRVLWDTSVESDSRQALAEQEEERIAPLQRPVCPVCWLELPRSMVCGYCA